MSAHNRKLKYVTFELDGTEYQVQLSNWTLENNSADGEKFFTYAEGGEFVEDSDPEYTLNMTFYSDWRSDGISDYLWQNDGETVAFTLDHHPDVSAEHVQFSGDVKIKAPSVGGEVRATETTEVAFAVVGAVTYTRI